MNDNKTADDYFMDGVAKGKEEERERCAKMVEDSTLITDSLLSRHKAVKELQFEIAKDIRENKETCKHNKGLTEYCEPCGRIHSKE